MPRYSHVYDLGFDVESNHPDGKDVTGAMLCKAILDRIGALDDDELAGACCNADDSYKTESDPEDESPDDESPEGPA